MFWILLFTLEPSTTSGDRPPSILDFEDLKSPSKIVLCLLTDYVYKRYCVTLANYYTSPEITTGLVKLKTDCYSTLKKKVGPPMGFQNWKPEKGTDLKKKI